MRDEKKKFTIGTLLVSGRFVSHSVSRPFNWNDATIVADQGSLSPSLSMDSSQETRVKLQTHYDRAGVFFSFSLSERKDGLKVKKKRKKKR